MVFSSGVLVDVSRWNVRYGRAWLRADHLDVVVHERARAALVAQLDQVGEFGVNVENVPRQLGRRGDVAARP
jgi:hypothetical protein